MRVALLAEFNLFRDILDAPVLTVELDFGRASFCWGEKATLPFDAGLRHEVNCNLQS